MPCHNRYIQALIMLVMLSAVWSCSRIPKHVIKPDDMASLLADIHVGESVVELNRSDYRTDSTKQLMLQSVLQRHGVTQQELDTSFDWYGHNISYYMEVYDKTIEILERRISDIGNRITAENISLAGDSVNVWALSPYLSVGRYSPTNMITFTLSHDDNWERGDSYTWRAKFTNNPETSLWAIVADYDDGSKEYVSAELSGEGWQELRFVCDSAKDVRYVYGYIDAVPRGVTSIMADSIMLVRNRLDEDTYRQHYRQTRIVSPKRGK